MTFGRLGRGSNMRPGSGGTKNPASRGWNGFSMSKTRTASIVIGGKDKARALEGARPVLPEVVRPKIAAFGAVVGLGRDRHPGEAHRIGRLAHVEQPSVAEALAAIGEIGLVGEHQEVAIGKRQRRMRSAAEGWVEVAMGEQLGDVEMFRLVHEMRVRIMTAPAFTGAKVIATILFEGTMDGELHGKPTPAFLWEDRGVVPFVKVDKGLEAEKDGVQVMRPMPELDALLTRAARLGVFGTKMRSVINLASKSRHCCRGGAAV